MKEKKDTRVSSRMFAWLIGLITFALVLGTPACSYYSDTKGPFKNSMQTVDLDGDGDLDVLVSHTRWETVDISWAGVGRWINHGHGMFKLLEDDQMDYFAGYAGGVGDTDLDGDTDLFVQDFSVRLLLNQSGQQGSDPGIFLWAAQIKPITTYNQGHSDMGGTIITGDLNGDGKVDALVTGCCYGMDPTLPEYRYEPSISWVWINDGDEQGFQSGHVLPLDILDGKPIREAALGDIDGDGDLDAFAAVGKPTLGTSDSQDDLILLNDGSGQLTIYQQSLGNTDSTSVALGDVNGDGRLDALVGTSHGARVWLNQSHALANGDPIFVQADQSFGSSRVKSVFLRDLDGDGDLDALLGRMWDAIIWWNDGQGEFTRSNKLFQYREDIGIAVGDFDGDGDQDVFAGNNSNNYYLWFNNGKGNFYRP